MKHRILYVLIFCCLIADCEAQQVIINGTAGNRPLIWEDFTGDPDKRSPWYANTAWYLGTKVASVTFKGDTAILHGLAFNLELDPKNSWIKKGYESDELLNHEQGHFNIALLFQMELIKESKKIIFFRSDFGKKLASFYDSLYKKYTAMNEKYDEETRHSANKAQQHKWDQFFKDRFEALR